MIAAENPEFVVQSLSEVDMRALIKALTDAGDDNAASDHAGTEDSRASLPSQSTLQMQYND